jgi:hypothetical protein
MNISIPHQLSQEEALARVKGLLSKLKEEQAGRVSDVKEEWNDNTGDFQFSAQGFNLAGQIAVQPSSVDIQADLPFALTFFKSTIERMISEKVTELMRS